MMEKKYPKILIAEDDIGFRRLLARFIQRAWPCKIIEAEDGVEVLQIILKEAPDLDLVILDISLPYVNGLQVLQIIRSNQRLEHLPIIACTAHGSEEDVARILEHGVNDFILKPSSKATILEKVARMLGMPEN